MIDNTARGTRCPAISVVPARESWLDARHGQRRAPATAELRQRLSRATRKCVYLADTTAIATAAFAGMPGLRAWSPPV